VLALQAGTHGGLTPALSWWLVIALLAMALDEQFMYHEYWKYHCHEWSSWCGRASARHADWLGDAPMALVGVGGLASAAALYRAAVSAPVRGLLVAAVAVGLVLALGTHYGHVNGLLAPEISQLEEVFEVFAEALFLCALLKIRPASNRGAQVQSAS